MNKKERIRKKQKIIRNKKLVKRYPFLLPRNVWTGKVVEDYNYEFTEYDSILDGWQIGFGKYLLEDLRDALIKNNYLHELRLLQVKEKFGELRIYTNGAPEDVRRVIDKYEVISQHVCSRCGSPYAALTDTGWVMPYCESCFQKINDRRSKGGYKPMDFNDVKCCDVGLPDSYRYSVFKNGEDKKITVDITETTNKIKKTWEKRIRKREHKIDG